MNITDTLLQDIENLLSEKSEYYAGYVYADIDHWTEELKASPEPTYDAICQVVAGLRNPLVYQIIKTLIDVDLVFDE